MPVGLSDSFFQCRVYPQKLSIWETGIFPLAGREFCHFKTGIPVGPDTSNVKGSFFFRRTVFTQTVLTRTVLTRTRFILLSEFCRDIWSYLDWTRNRIPGLIGIYFFISTFLSHFDRLLIAYFRFRLCCLCS